VFAFTYDQPKARQSGNESRDKGWLLWLSGGKAKVRKHIIAGRGPADILPAADAADRKALA
jgi:hypothetical protein